MNNLSQLLNSGSAANTIIMVSAQDLKDYTDNLIRETRRAVEEQFQPRYFNAADLMKLFKISRTTLYLWERNGKLPAPYIPEGTDKKLWDQAEIRDWVAAGRVGRYIQHK